MKESELHMKVFNTTTVCIPSKHYMVDLSERVAQIKKMVDAGKYFSINRARQYGKTTTLNALKKYLTGGYQVIFLDFQGIGNAGYDSEEKFVQEFCRLLWNRGKVGNVIPKDILNKIRIWKEAENPRTRLGELFDTLSDWCAQSEKKIVLIIDDVDSVANHHVFLDFLAQLREKYIGREIDDIATFQSVILSGVTDVNNLKNKVREDGKNIENSPWNIASDFTVDMSLSENGIKRMLDQYDADHNTCMDTAYMAKQIYDYTNGYPFLVSRICQLIDEMLVPNLFDSLKNAWTKDGLNEAIKLILSENNTLFQILAENLNNYPELKQTIRNIIMEDERLTWNLQQQELSQMQMYGLIRKDHNSVRISNRIFETMLYNLFLSDEGLDNSVRGS